MHHASSACRFVPSGFVIKGLFLHGSPTQNLVVYPVDLHKRDYVTFTFISPFSPQTGGLVAPKTKSRTGVVSDNCPVFIDHQYSGDPWSLYDGRKLMDVCDTRFDDGHDDRNPSPPPV